MAVTFLKNLVREKAASPNEENTWRAQCMVHGDALKASIVVRQISRPLYHTT